MIARTCGVNPAHSRDGYTTYVLNSLCFSRQFSRGRQARAEAQFLKAFPGLKAGAPTVRRKRRVNSIAACRAVPHELCGVIGVNVNVFGGEIAGEEFGAAFAASELDGNFILRLRQIEVG